MRLTFIRSHTTRPMLYGSFSQMIRTLLQRRVEEFVFWSGMDGLRVGLNSSPPGLDLNTWPKEMDGLWACTACWRVDRVVSGMDRGDGAGRPVQSRLIVGGTMERKGKARQRALYESGT